MSCAWVSWVWVSCIVSCEVRYGPFCGFEIWTIVSNFEVSCIVSCAVSCCISERVVEWVVEWGMRLICIVSWCVCPTQDVMWYAVSDVKMFLFCFVWEGGSFLSATYPFLIFSSILTGQYANSDANIKM